jgi:putative transposase
MVEGRVDDEERHSHFVTCSCFKRRQLLQADQAKRIVIGQLGHGLAKHAGLCPGYVVMPDHVHVLLWFSRAGQLAALMDEWKGRSSQALKRFYSTRFPRYWSRIDPTDPIWQARYYAFNLWSRRKFEEKLTYLHRSPVRAGLADRPEAWPWSSARWYLLGKSVGMPIGWPPGLETDDTFVVDG